MPIHTGNAIPSELSQRLLKLFKPLVVTPALEMAADPSRSDKRLHFVPRSVRRQEVMRQQFRSFRGVQQRGGAPHITAQESLPPPSHLVPIPLSVGVVCVK